MVAEVVRQFFDVDSGTPRNVGDRFELTPERFAAINETKYGILVKEALPETVTADETPESGTVEQESAGAKKRPRRNTRRSQTEQKED